MKIGVSRFEGKVIQFGVVGYWVLFWLLNVVDKIIPGKAFLWVGKDRYAQLEGYFASIGVNDQLVVRGFLGVTTVLETIALVLVAAALMFLIVDRVQRAQAFFFWGTFVGLVIFSFFSIGDQIFGDRVELLEHTIYWVALIVSWGAYKYFPRV